MDWLYDNHINIVHTVADHQICKQLWQYTHHNIDSL